MKIATINSLNQFKSHIPSKVMKCAISYKKNSCTFSERGDFTDAGLDATSDPDGFLRISMPNKYKGKLYTCQCMVRNRLGTAARLIIPTTSGQFEVESDTGYIRILLNQWLSISSFSAIKPSSLGDNEEIEIILTVNIAY